MRGQDFGDHRPYDRRRRQLRAAAVTFVLQPDVRERGRLKSNAGEPTETPRRAIDATSWALDVSLDVTPH